MDSLFGPTPKQPTEYTAGLPLFVKFLEPISGEKGGTTNYTAIYTKFM
jgi:hypothetical protein